MPATSMSRAGCISSHAQASAAVASKAAPTIQRSRAAGGVAASGGALWGEIESGDMGVAGLPAQRDRAGRFRRAAGELGFAIFETAGQADPGAVLRAGDRVADRLDRRLDQPFHHDPARAPLEIGL